MKFIPLLFLPLLLHSQPCPELTKTIDKFTGEVNYKLTDPMILGHGDDVLALDIGMVGKTKYLISIGENLGCTDGNSYLLVLYDDGTTFEAVNAMSFNCNGSIMVALKGIYVGTQSVKNIFTKRIKSIRAKGLSHSIDVDLDNEDSDLLLKSLQCFNQIAK